MRQRAIRQRLVSGFQRRILNPVTLRIARYIPGQLIIETIGRRSGEWRRTPVGGRRVGARFWLVSEFGYDSDYIRNIMADPRVRVWQRGQRYDGTAHILEHDDARQRLRRLPWLNSLAVRLVGTKLLTVRIDLSGTP